MTSNQTDALNEAISVLQNKQALELKLLKEQAYVTYESLKPINLIKKTFAEVKSSDEIRGSIIDSAIGLAIGYLSKKLLFGATRNPVTKLMGALLQLAITKVASSNAGTIKSAAENMLQRFAKNKKATWEEYHLNGAGE